MGDNKMTDSGMVELTGKIMVVAIIVMFLVVTFVFFLHLYAKWFWYRREELVEGPNRRRRRSDFSGGHDELTTATAATILRRGLDASALKLIPVVQFDPKDFKDGLECTVCLSELTEGEKTRILPKCNHGFHVDCIDMWFQSHSTCPICRNPVIDQSETSSENSLESLLETPAQNPTDFPTNVLFWGNEVRVNAGDPNLENGLYQVQPPPPASLEPSSSSSTSIPSSQTVNRPDGSTVIDIAMEIDEEDNEDQKSPVTSRMSSFKRLFGRDKRVNPSSPNSSDLELGSRGQS